MRGVFAVLLLTGAVVAVLSLFLQSKSVAQINVPPDTTTRGPYMLAGGDRNFVWRIDQSTGKVSYCQVNSTSTDPKIIATRAPFCSAWSEK